MRKERPILYSTPMIKAKLSGLKTQTRRIIKPQPKKMSEGIFGGSAGFVEEDYEWLIPKSSSSIISCKKNGPDSYTQYCPYGKIGDWLWSRETWQTSYNEKTDSWEPIFKADAYYFDEDGPTKWKPSIHMKKSYARIWDEIVDIRVERLQDISKEDAIAEGIEREESGQELVKETFYKNYLGDGINVRNWTRSPVASYKSLWGKINGIGSWDENPWVWVIETKTLSTTGRP